MSGISQLEEQILFEIDEEEIIGDISNSDDDLTIEINFPEEIIEGLSDEDIVEFMDEVEAFLEKKHISKKGSMKKDSLVSRMRKHGKETENALRSGDFNNKTDKKVKGMDKSDMYKIQGVGTKIKIAQYKNKR